MTMPNVPATSAGPRETRREHIRQLMGLCEERLRTHPGDVHSLMTIAQALWQMGQRAGAIEYLGKILACHPGHPEVRETFQHYSAEIAAGGPYRKQKGGRP